MVYSTIFNLCKLKYMHTKKKATLAFKKNTWENTQPHWDDYGVGKDNESGEWK